MTPLQIRALLDVLVYDCGTLPQDHPLRDAARNQGPDVWRQALGALLTPRLIEWRGDDPGPKLTDRGRAYVQILGMVPFPVLSWTCPGLPPMTIGENHEVIPR